jgi:outer membrane receptor protein involved in Fe transport
VDGAEHGARWVLTRALTFSASYTWYNFAIRDTFHVSPNTPTHKGTVALDYAGPRGITLSVDARIVAGYHWTSGVWDGNVPASQTVNLNAGYRISPHLRVYASSSDILNQQRFATYGGAVIGRRVLAGVTSTF